VADAVAVAGGRRLGVVGAAVVDDDALDGGVGLGQDAVDGLRQIAGLLVTGDDDGDQRLIGHCRSSLGPALTPGPGPPAATPPSPTPAGSCNSRSSPPPAAGRLGRCGNSCPARPSG